MDFWENHTIWFVIAISIFPRLTMLFATAYGGGLLYWIGWLFVPRLTVAVIATILYRETNLEMVILAWLLCIIWHTSQSE